MRYVAGTGSANDPDLTADRPLGNARYWSAMRSLRKVPVVENEIDLAHASKPNVPARDSRYDLALRKNAMNVTPEFQVAPLK